MILLVLDDSGSTRDNHDTKTWSGHVNRSERETWYQDALAGRRPYGCLDWVAQDGTGSLGLFASAGMGPIPDVALKPMGAFFAVQRFLLKQQIARGLKPSADDADWEIVDTDLAADTGLYVYEYGNVSSYSSGMAYTRAVIPSNPLKVDCIAAELRGWLESCSFPGIEFSDVELLVVERFFSKLNT